MRSFLLLSLLAVLSSGVLAADRIPFAKHRFSLKFPDDWKKAKGPDDGHVLYRESPDGSSAFSVFMLELKEDHRADLKGTLKNQVEALAKAGLKVTDDVEGQEGAVDGKKAVFAVIPVEAELPDQTVKLRYYLVLVDAKDTVVIMQAVLPSAADAEIQKSALDIIQSFKEEAGEEKDEE